MIKRILVALDESAASRAAQILAIDIARRQSAEITGIGVVDKPWITAPRATPIGAGHYKEHRDQVILEEFREKVGAILASFEEACSTAGVSFAALEAEGIPAETIEAEADAHDVIAIGRDTNFHFESTHDTAKAVARLIRDNPRPLLVTPAAKVRDHRILVCYDGSLQASRAMHMFVLLGLAADKEIHLVSVARSKEQAGALARRGARIFENHGIAVQLHDTESHADAADVLLAEADALKPGLLVMGAFGHTGLREFILGSATRSLLHNCESTPLFIHH